MSVKRQATTELNHENWDQEEEETEEMGTYKTASKEELGKRVIRTAKRRAPMSSEEPKKSVFSGFGFNKTQPASFDFLSKLTNGSNTNGSPDKAETTSSLFTSKPSNTQGSGLFGIPTSQNQPLGTTITQSGSLFGAANNAGSTASLFSTTKSDSTVNDSPFKIPSMASKSDSIITDTKTSTPLPTSKFSMPTTTANANKSLFTISPNNTAFKIQPKTNTTAATSFGTTAKVPSETQKGPDDSKKLKYYSKLKGLNESVSEWIKKHVSETPLCILSPIFKDYENYLKEIQDEYHGSGKEDFDKKSDEKNIPETKLEAEKASSQPAGVGEKSSSLFKMPTTKPSVLAPSNNDSADKPATFSFGIQNASTTTTAASSSTTAPGFTFGVTASNQSTTSSSLFPFSTSTTNNTNGAPSFSFGGGKPFGFNSNVQQSTEKTDETNDDEDTPPKVEFTPVVEENSIYDKRCKLFVKKDGNFVDKGVGTLYIKKIEDTGKHQLLVRANTNLGTILVNLIMASAIPTQRMGKNNVMMVCIPTPDSKPPPTPILIRVKTSEEADELLETLNKYKT